VSNTRPHRRRRQGRDSGVSAIKRRHPEPKKRRRRRDADGAFGEGLRPDIVELLESDADKQERADYEEIEREFPAGFWRDGAGGTGEAPLVGTGDRVNDSPAMNGETAAQLEAEANAAIATAPLDTVEAPEVTGALVPMEESHVEEWKVFMGHTVGVVAVVALPQWELTGDEKRELSESLAGCLDQLFPGGLDGKYACWFRLVAAAGGITVVRLAQNGGKLPGFGPRRKSDTDTEAPTPAPAAG